MSVINFPLDRIVRMPSEVDETTDLYWHEREQFPDRPEAELWADIRDLERSYGDLIRRQHPRYVGVLHSADLMHPHFPHHPTREQSCAPKSLD